MSRFDAKLNALVKYAHEWPDIVEGPRPCIVTIGRKSWPAVWYKQERKTSPGCRAYSEGERKHYVEALYCLGSDLPAAKKRGNACFPWAADGREWYVGAYGPKVIKKEFAQYHKMGHSFMLMPWSVPDGGSIDQYERHPYKRVPMHVEFV